jgi:hypothetical protein
MPRPAVPPALNVISTVNVEGRSSRGKAAGFQSRNAWRSAPTRSVLLD